VTNLGPVVGKSCRIMAFPLRIKGSDAGHARIVAELN
jgi:kynurenine formamidase